MRSLNRHVVQERIALVVDTSVGTNATAKALNGHLAALRKSGGVETQSSGVEGLEAFVKEAGKAGRPKVKRGGR